MKYWGLRLGEGGKYAEVCKKGDFVAVGWTALGDTSCLHGMDRNAALAELRQRVKQAYGGSEVRVGISTGSFWKFIFEMQPGDRVLCPWPARRLVLIGETTGPHEHRDAWGDGCDYTNRRTVRWIREVHRDHLPERLKASLGAFVTVFRLDEHKVDIEALLAGTTPAPLPRVELPVEIVRRILKLKPREFEQFITHLLRLAGFEAATTSYVGDKGVDVVGTLNAEGLASITLRVQAKRVAGSVGIQEVLKTRGTLGPDDHGAIVTTGRFTAQAREDAEDQHRTPIRLIDRDGLVDLILGHYDELDEKYQRLLSLRRRRVPLIEQFEFAEDR